MNCLPRIYDLFGSVIYCRLTIPVIKEGGKVKPLIPGYNMGSWEDIDDFYFEVWWSLTEGSKHKINSHKQLSKFFFVIREY